MVQQKAKFRNLAYIVWIIKHIFAIIVELHGKTATESNFIPL